MPLDYLLHHILFHPLETVPDKVAVRDNQMSLTYQQFSRRAGYVAAQLKQYGCARGDRVAFFLNHSIDQALAIVAISNVGGVFVPINQVLFPEQVGHILKDSGARFLITNSMLVQSLRGEEKTCPELGTVILMEDMSGSEPLVRTCHCIENDLACLLYTSGSTGSPKGVMFSHRNLLAGCDIVSDYLGLRQEDSLLGVLRLSFDYGLNQLLTMLAKGGTYRFLDYRFPEEIVRALAEEEYTGLAGVPQTWLFLVRSTLAGTDLPHLRYITNSGGPVPMHIIEFLKKALPGTDIVLMYGLTEAFRSTYLKPSELGYRPTSMGKAIPNTEILVVSDDGRICQPGEVGELVHRGPTVTLGYWNQPDATAATFRMPSFSGRSFDGGERVVYSGDLVRYDDEGYLYFVGRKDAMIKSSGIRVSPGEVEEVVYRSRLVHEAAAVGIPDQIAGQVIKVFVTADETEDKAGLEKRIINFCLEHMPDYMIPRSIEFVTEIPKTPHGKTDYPALQKRDRT